MRVSTIKISHILIATCHVSNFMYPQKGKIAV